jgi:DNA repair protein RadC
MKIKDLPKFTRPREKIKFKGPQSLSDFELLQALIGSGNKQADVTKIAKEVKNLLQKYGVDITYSQLEKINGLGAARIAELLAAFELSKRYLIEPDQPLINSAEDIVDQLKEIRDKKQEYLVCLSLDGANRLIAKRIITIGTLNANLIHPREVFADAITDRAAGIIVAHNHPSETLRPSENDIKVTKKLQQAGEILGITLLDHIIITKNKYLSFAEEGLMK